MTHIIEKMQAQIDALQAEVASLRADLNQIKQAPRRRAIHGDTPTLMGWARGYSALDREVISVRNLAIEALDRAKDTQRKSKE